MFDCLGFPGIAVSVLKLFLMFQPSSPGFLQSWSVTQVLLGPLIYAGCRSSIHGAFLLVRAACLLLTNERAPSCRSANVHMWLSFSLSSVLKLLLFFEISTASFIKRGLFYVLYVRFYTVEQYPMSCLVTVLGYGGFSVWFKLVFCMCSLSLSLTDLPVWPM